MYVVAMFVKLRGQQYRINAANFTITTSVPALVDMIFSFPRVLHLPRFHLRDDILLDEAKQVHRIVCLAQLIEYCGLSNDPGFQ